MTGITQQPTSPGEAATGSQCCSDFYEQDWVRFLAEDSFHPGGSSLTHRTIKGMRLLSGASVLDLGCGTGTTTRTLAEQFDYAATGLDRSERNIALARTLGRQHQTSFVRGDAYDLPFADASFDGVITECVLSLLFDKAAALTELRRILKPGGSIGITDMSVNGALPDEFAREIAPWTCLEAAPNGKEYEKLFRMAGFELVETANESEALRDMVRRLKRRLLLAAAGGLATGRIPFDLATIRHWLDRFEAVVSDDLIRYLRFQLRF